MANKKGSRQLAWTDRISIEALKKAGHSVIEIAEQLGVHRSTIYNELKRGEYMHRNSDYTETLSYSPNKAQMKAEENLKARGTQLKIGNDIAYANYIEDKIVNEDYSPAAVLGELKAQGKEVSRGMLKGLEKRKINLLAKLEKVEHAIKTRTDDVVDFKQMGIDHLFIDESHYPNLNKIRTFTYNMLRNRHK